MAEQSARADNSASRGATERAGKLARAYLEALRAADAPGAYKIASGALAEGMSLSALYQQVIAPAMYEVGRLWEKGAITVADEHLATALTHRVVAALRPPSSVGGPSGAVGGMPRAILAAVEGEQHALGLRMAADVLEDAGYQTIYLGADVPTGALLQAVDTFSPDLVGLSATMPESRKLLEDAVARIRKGHPHLQLLIGGRASRSPRIDEGTPVEDLELLEERVRAA
ncbi:MAG TPA: B12-binding domain-containing protein [Solirubrobacterales bacterium]|nr:B12-binding domain-containing protein [Solirubrobacterales bacterium]